VDGALHIEAIRRKPDDLYKQRFEIYMAFHELLVAVGERHEVEVEFR
jgi:hypothetical protein